MRMRSVVRDVVLAVAVAGLGFSAGWWVRSAGTTVLAESGGSSGDGLGFQMIGTGPGSTLALYNPENKTLYVYARAGAGESTVNCTYSFTISAPGAPLQRKNCPVGRLR